MIAAMLHQIKSKLLLITSFIVFFLAAAYIICLYRSNVYLKQARELQQKNQIAEAIADYRKAIEWRAPGNYYAENAITELSSLAYHTTLDQRLRILALQELKRGLLTSRSFINPELSADPSTLSGQATLELDKIHNIDPNNIIRESNFPKQHYLWQLLTSVFFWGWSLSFLGAIWFGMNKDGQIIKANFLRASLLTIICYGLWILSLRMA